VLRTAPWCHGGVDADPQAVLKPSNPTGGSSQLWADHIPFEWEIGIMFFRNIKNIGMMRISHLFSEYNIIYIYICIYIYVYICIYQENSSHHHSNIYMIIPKTLITNN